MSPGNCVGAGMGAGWEGLPILYQRCYISVMGWGGEGEGITGAMEVETPHPQASKCSFLFKVFFYSLGFFFFPCGWGLVNFLKVLFNLGGESVAALQARSFPPPLHPPGRLSLSTSLFSLSLKPPPPQLHPILTASLSCVLSLGSRAQLPKAQSSFSP